MTLLSESEAFAIAAAFFHERYADHAADPSDRGWILLREGEENEDFYAYFYNSRGWLTKENVSFALAGNGPIVVNKRTGRIHPVGSHMTWQEFVERDEEH